MGILDDAIRDHLDLKRRRGAEEPELKRLEDEAFGPQGRPDASGAPSPTASAIAERPAESGSPEITPEDLGLESLPETPPPDGPAPEEPPAPAPDPGSPPDTEPSASGGGDVVFHDFAAEEGLIPSGSAPSAGESSAPVEPTDPVERALAQPTPEPPAAEPADEAPEAEAPADEAPAPTPEDTQVHDMAKELDLRPDEPSTPDDSVAPATEDETAEAGDAPALELEVEELDIELDDELDAADPEGDAEDSGESEDVLEETPEFLRDAPDSDRLWFEQGKPKDFDFDED